MTQAYSTCPECSHNRKKRGDRCLSTNSITGVFLCHHCGYSGKNGEETKMSTITETEFKPSRPMEKKEIKLPSTSLPDNVIEWFKLRGIDQAILERNKIGHKEGLITFPFFKGGKLVNIKYRSQNKKFKQEAGAEKIFYGLDDIAGHEEIIIVEGEIDKLSFEVAEYKNVISVPDGAPSLQAKSYEAKFSYIQNCEKELEGVKKIILAVDHDAPGKKLEAELIRRLSPERCWRVIWPEGCKDANEMLIKHSEARLIQLIEEAEPVPVAGLFSVTDFEKELSHLYENGQKGGESTGWHSMDNNYTVRVGELSIVTGIPSHGKSEFIDALMVNLSIKSEWRFAVFSPENYPVQTHIAKLVQKFAGKPFSKNFRDCLTKDELQTATIFLNEHFTFINPPSDELTVDHIISKAKVAVMRYGIKGLCLDPWNEIEHSRQTGKTETEYISECLTKLRRFARSYGVHIWLIAHPTKLQRGRDGKYPIPTPYDIAGSAHFRNKADNCLCVWRDLLEEEKAVDIHVQKIRFREVGRVGVVSLKYDVSSGRYEKLN